MLLRLKEEVEFDPHNPDHVNAIRYTLKSGRLHPDFRFRYDAPFTSGMTSAIYKMAEEYMMMAANAQKGIVNGFIQENIKGAKASKGTTMGLSSGNGNIAVLKPRDRPSRETK